jgi:glycosyltransferase involved in cell wall biosynthesis
MKILLATDAWRPQVNGVVRTYEQLVAEARAAGDEIVVLGPAEFRTVPCPGYRQIQLAIPDYGKAFSFVRACQPDAIHIATEGPVGRMVRRYCQKHDLPFSTSYHTKFPEYLATRFWIPAALTYASMRRFHNSGGAMMVATQSLADDLRARGFKTGVAWSRGVDTKLFQPRPVRQFGEDRVLLYVGRVASEKNIEAFLSAKAEGRKIVVGDGPELAKLRRQFPDAVFTGELSGDRLAEAYASADVFVFPSLTDTFGIVLLEAMASGLPVAAYPVTGPKDVVMDAVTGSLNRDLAQAIEAASGLKRARIRATAETYSWSNVYRQFLSNLRKAQSRHAEFRISKSRQPVTSR